MLFSFSSSSFFNFLTIISSILFSGMMTRFSKAKLVEAQEKKANTSPSGGHLSRKCQRENEPSKDDVMVTFSVTKFQVRRPASPTSSLELIVSPRGALRPKPQARSRLPPFGKMQGL